MHVRRVCMRIRVHSLRSSLIKTSHCAQKPLSLVENDVLGRKECYCQDLLALRLRLYCSIRCMMDLNAIDYAISVLVVLFLPLN